METCQHKGNIYRRPPLCNEQEPVGTPQFARGLDSHSGTLTKEPYLAWQSTPTEKLLLVLASIIPLLTSTVLLVISVGNTTSSGPLLPFVLENRATTQIIVSLISAFLAFLNLYTINKLLNLATRVYLLQRPLSLKMISFIRAISTSSFAAGLPAAMSSTAVVIALLFGLPNILWTGALTPVLTNTTLIERNIMKIPRYSADSNTTWAAGAGYLGRGECNAVTNNHGIFGKCPVSIIQSSLLNRASQATSNLTQSHIKNDNSHYSFIGRSYGVGSSAGLVDESLSGGQSTSKLLAYNYTEPGYLTNVTCFHNASSDFHLQIAKKGEVGYGIPYVYYATGLFPNAKSGNSPDFYAVTGIGGDQNIATVAAKQYEGRNVILVTAGSNYIDLNSTQCEVNFTPANFEVGIEVTERLISVKPIIATDHVDSSRPSFDPSSGLALAVIDQLNALGMISTSLYTSVIGDALMSNVKAATTDSSSPHPTAFDAMGDSFSAIFDALLVFIGSSQFFVPYSGAGDFSTVDAHLTVQAVRLGEIKYVVATFAVCSLLLVAVVIEACRTKFWKWLPQWDFMDTTTLILSSAIAGEDLVVELCRNHREGQMQWTGRSGDRATKVELSLGRKVLNVSPTYRVKDVDADMSQGEGFMTKEQVQLNAVSLWTSGAKDTTPLM
ncbi:MAG: hypothetical protein Q9166_002879 [cf. Caloplaca sp. 2 TL-2023]